MNKHFRYFLLALCVLSGMIPSYAGRNVEVPKPILSVNQQSNITAQGTVVDVSGEPVIGATVKVKGTAQGTITDINGEFSIQIPLNATLEISYIGYTTQLTKVIKAGKLKITLKEDTKVLDEVIVVGYGTTSTRKNTASLATVDNEKVKEVPFSDMGSALQGRVAGVIVQQGSAEPGQNGASISIRGNGTPLYVIDGFVVLSLIHI